MPSYLAEAGFGSMSREEFHAADRAAASVFGAGREHNAWKLDDAEFALFASIATNYDRQLRHAPLWAITEASERLDRLIIGRSDSAPVRKQA